MSSSDVSDAELRGYLDEILSIERMSAVESALRTSPALRQRAAILLRERDAGGGSVGEVWQRERLSCPTRGQLGSFLLDALDPGYASYIRFHLNTVGCRFCRANLEDIQAAQVAGAAGPQRRQKIFESSVGKMPTRTLKPNSG